MTDPTHRLQTILRQAAADDGPQSAADDLTVDDLFRVAEEAGVPASELVERAEHLAASERP